MGKSELVLVGRAVPVLLNVRLSAKRRALRAFSLSQKRALSAPFLSFL